MKKGSKLSRKAYIKPSRKEATVNLYRIKAVEFDEVILAVEAT